MCSSDLLFASSVLIVLLPFVKGKNSWGRRIAIFCLLFCSCFFVGAEIKKNLFPSWSAMFLDVGQGDCILLESPAGKFYLIDTGPPLKKRSMANDRIVPYFRSQGISKIDAMIITHNHADHNGNEAAILKEFPVLEVWKSPALHKGLIIKEKLLLSESEWSITVLHPDSGVVEKNENNNSIVLKVQGLGKTLLLTGDLEKQGEIKLLSQDIKSDVIKLGHHGSKTSSTREFLEQSAPSSAIISVGARNVYRHPSKEVLERLDSLGIKHYGTHENGSIRVRFREKGYEVEGYRGRFIQRLLLPL